MPPGPVSPRSPFLGAALLLLFALAVAGGPAFARKVGIADDSRRCISTSIGPHHKLANASACIAHNSCSRTIFASFDAYPFHARQGAAPAHAKVTHWLEPGDNEVFGWNSSTPLPQPECKVLDSHY
jgi:hypothetical protein